jgi:hypothetical protein
MFRHMYHVAHARTATSKDTNLTLTEKPVTMSIGQLHQHERPHHFRQPRTNRTNDRSPYSRKKEHTTALPISMFTVMEPPLHPQPHPARTSFPNENHELNQHISQQIEGSTVHSKQAHSWSLIVCFTAPNFCEQRRNAWSTNQASRGNQTYRQSGNEGTIELGRQRTLVVPSFRPLLSGLRATK